MPAAARATDKISHTLAAGFGTTSGLLSMGLTILTSPGSAMVYGVLIMFGEEHATEAGMILTGSPNVMVGSLPAVRAGQDVAMCTTHDGAGVLVAQGSTTVLVNGKMAGRITSLLACSGKVSSGKYTVLIGGATGQAVAISPEVPAWAMTALTLMSLEAGLLMGGAAAFVLGLFGSRLGTAAGAKIGGAIANATGGDQDQYQRVGGKIGGLVGGFLGAKAAGMGGAEPVSGASEGEPMPGGTSGDASGVTEASPPANEPTPAAPADEPAPGANESPSPNESSTPNEDAPPGEDPPGNESPADEGPNGDKDPGASEDGPGKDDPEDNQRPDEEGNQEEEKNGEDNDQDKDDGEDNDKEDGEDNDDKDDSDENDKDGQEDDENPGDSSDPEDPATCGDPVAVATGALVDDAVDFLLPGLIPFEWKRSYSSQRTAENGDLGVGGWVHGFDQWIEERDRSYCLHVEDGRRIYFAKIQLGEETFHRRERLTLRRGEDGRFSVESAKTGLVRQFAQARGGGFALSSVRDQRGNTLLLEYERDRLARVTDTAGRLVRLLHDDAGRIRRVEVWSAGPTRERWQWVEYGYGAGGELATVMDALGAVTRYSYDREHRITQRTLPDGLSFHYEYDRTSGRCTRSVGDGGIYDTRFDFDVAAKTTRVEEGPELRVFTWNDAAMVVREATPDGAWARASSYDEDQYKLSETDPSGRTTRSEYDVRGNLVARTDAAGNVTRWSVERDRPVLRRDPDGGETRYAYDASGNLVWIRTRLGLTYQLWYDELGRLVGVRDDGGAVVRLAYDAQHNVIQELDARGAMTSYAYDPLGRAIARRDGLGRETRVAYDAVGRVVQVLLPDGTARRTAYDACGRVVQRVDGAGQVTSFEYGGLKALRTLIEPNGDRWTFSHDVLERLVQITNPRRENYSYEYDAVGHVSQERSFHGRLLRYAYSGDDLASIGYPDGGTRTFRYDVLGGLLEDVASDSAITYQRDRLGRLTTATVSDRSGKVVTAFERDELGRIVAEAHGGQVIRYAYDRRGYLASRVLPNGATTRYQYDAAGDFAGVDHDGHEVSVHRDLAGREVRREVRTSGVQIRSAYDAMDRLAYQEATAPKPEGYEAAAVLSRRRWRYDAAGRVAAIDDVRWGTTFYAYDTLGRLIGAARGAHREVFDYDSAGSLGGILDDLSKLGRGPAWKIGEGNLLEETEDATYENDLHGRRTKKVEKRTGRTTEYAWDRRDQLREVTFDDGRRARYTYDAFGRRVRKELVTGDGARRVTDFLWDRDVLAAELGNDRGLRVFVHVPGSFAPMLQQEQGQVFTYVNDHHGMPKELLGEDGRVAWSAIHSAWGEALEVWRDPSARVAVETPFRMLGQYLDKETALCYTRFRYFDPKVARWLSPDPIGVRGGANLLGWDGNPANEVDPFGLATGSCEAPSAEDGGEVWNDRGGVDFSNSSALRAQVQIKYTGSRKGDYQAANQAAGLGDSTRPPSGLTWHHLDDYNPQTNTGTMQLVDQGTHVANTPHFGGVAQWAQASGRPYAP